MKFIKLLTGIIFIALIGGFIALGFIDVPVQQQDVVKEIPHEKLFKND